MFHTLKRLWQSLFEKAAGGPDQIVRMTRRVIYDDQAMAFKATYRDLKFNARGKLVSISGEATETIVNCVQSPA